MWKTIILIFFAFICFSCGFNGSNDTLSIGDDFIQTGNTVAVVDSYTVNLSTVILDSVTTSAATVLWAGTYTDKELGIISSTGYCEVGVPSTPNVEKDDLYDSLLLVMNYSKGYYGDTTVQQNLNIYRVTQEIAGDVSGDLYNRTSITYDQNPIGNITFKPRPLTTGALKIRLSDQIGQNILQMLKNKDETVGTFEKFRDYFKGIALGAGNQSTAVLGFVCDTSLNLVLYSHRIGLEREEIKQYFPLGSTTTAYNHFTADRTGTPIATIAKPEVRIPSSQSGYKTFMESGIGLMTRVDFPYMQRLMEMDRKYVLLKAELYLIPEPGTYKQVNLPTKLVLFHSDKTNRVVSEIVGTNNTAINAEYQIDYVYNEGTYYKFNITDFLTTEISDSYFDTDHGLLIGETTKSLGVSLNRVVFSDRKNSAYKPVVKLYFMYYKL